MKLVKNIHAIALFSIACTAGASSSAIDLPLVLTPDTDLDTLPGHAAEFTRNVPGFDSQNRPYIRSRTADIDQTGFIHSLREGDWQERPFLPVVREAYPEFANTWRGAGWFEPRVIFDSKDRLYTQIRITLEGGERRNLLIYSADFGSNFQILELPMGSVIAEHRAGHNQIDGPPFIMIADRLSDHSGEFATRNRLSVVRPRWEGDALVLPEPVVVTENLVGLEQHSGGAPFAATRDGRTHFVWAGITEPEIEPELTPTWIATYDHDEGSATEPLLLTRTPPGNNAHNMPGIVLDSDGFLHVVTGAHFGESFHYLRSKEPGAIDKGWTDPQPVWNRGWKTGAGDERGGQTYVALVCDREDTLHLVFRHWRRESEKYPHLDEQSGDYFGALAYQRKKPGEAWSEPVRLVVPPRNIYSIYYHRLSVDHAGNLYLSFSYLDQELLETPSVGRYPGRMLWVSSDQGDTWRFAETTDFAEAVSSE